MRPGDTPVQGGAPREAPPRADLDSAPCLLEMVLVQPDPADDAWLRPVPPSAALAHLLQPITREIDERIRLTSALSGALAPLMAVADEDPNHAITVLEGRSLIISVLREASTHAKEEVLTAQPGGNRLTHNMRQGLENARSAIASGARLKHIYQHPARYSPGLKDYVAEIPPDRLQVRTVEQTVERLIIFDRAVAYIPATPTRETALEIRHPALVTYLTQVYEVLWAQATPSPSSSPQPSPAPPSPPSSRASPGCWPKGTSTTWSPASWASASAPAAPTSPSSCRHSTPAAGPTWERSSSGPASPRPAPGQHRGPPPGS